MLLAPVRYEFLRCQNLHVGFALRIHFAETIQILVLHISLISISVFHNSSTSLDQKTFNMFSLSIANKLSSFALLLCCVCVSLVSCVRYDGAMRPDTYVEYQNARPVQDGQDGQTRVFTFPHDGQFHGGAPLYDFTTRRPSFEGSKQPESMATDAPSCCGSANQQVINSRSPEDRYNRTSRIIEINTTRNKINQSIHQPT